MCPCVSLCLCVCVGVGIFVYVSLFVHLSIILLSNMADSISSLLSCHYTVSRFPIKDRTQREVVGMVFRVHSLSKSMRVSMDKFEEKYLPFDSFPSVL